VFTRRQANSGDRNRPRRRSPWLIGGIAALLLTGLAADATAVATLAQAPVVATENPSHPFVRNVDTDDDFTAALAKLETLPIKGRAPKTGYSRGAFGPAWTDDVNVEGGRNGCDTRNDILRRDLIDITLKPGSNGCTVLSGTLIDPYSGKTIPFTRGANTSADVQIDHVVALSDAWQKGAQQLDQTTRQDFANDPRNLQATSGAMNKQKADGDAATWLPPNKAYRCTFVSRQVEVKAAYGLWVTQAEHDAIANLLIGCGATAPASASATDDRTLTPAPVAPAPRFAAVEPLPPLAPSTTPVPKPSSTPGGRTVHPGSFCSPAGATGVSNKGQPMICGPDKNGKNRWTAQ
jgi:hypothetical protein